MSQVKARKSKPSEGRRRIQYVLLNLLRQIYTLGFKDILPLFLNHLFWVVGVPFIYLFVSVLIWVSAPDTGSLFHVQ